MDEKSNCFSLLIVPNAVVGIRDEDFRAHFALKLSNTPTVIKIFLHAFHILCLRRQIEFIQLMLTLGAKV
jgi:hypothetical protein